MKRATFVLLWVAGLVLDSRAAQAQLKVVATTTPLAALAREVGGSLVTVEALSSPNQDPHWVDARPHLALKLARADLLLVVGLGLEVGWLPTLQQGSRNRRIQKGAPGYLDCSAYVHRLEVATEQVDRSMGDIHPEGNPHYLYDPRQAVAVAAGIADRLGQLDPSHRSGYAANLQALERRLSQARSRWEKSVSPLRGGKLIAYHRSFAYLADWLGFSVIGHLEPRPGVPPNPRHVATLLSLAREQGVRLILQESFSPDRTARLLAERSGASVLPVPSGPSFDRGESYEDFIDRVIALLSGAQHGGQP